MNNNRTRAGQARTRPATASVLRRVASAAAIAVVTAAAATAALAHHSREIFDEENPIELTGTILEWQFENPHVFIVLDVDGEEGKHGVWSLEGLSPNVMRRQGWDAESLQPGDRITVTVHPLHSGAPGGSYRVPRWEDGPPIDPRMPRPQ